MASPYIYIGLNVGGGALLFAFGPYIFGYLLGAPLSNAFNTENQPYSTPASTPGFDGYRDYRGNVSLGQIITVDNINFKLAGIDISSAENHTMTDAFSAKYKNLTFHFAIQNRNALPVELNGSMFQIESYTEDGEFYRYYPVKLIEDTTGAESLTIPYDKEYPATLLSTVGTGDEQESSYQLAILGKDKRVVFGLAS